MGQKPRYSGEIIKGLQDRELKRNATNVYNIHQVDMWLSGYLTNEQLKYNIKEV